MVDVVTHRNHGRRIRTFSEAAGAYLSIDIVEIFKSEKFGWNNMRIPFNHQLEDFPVAKNRCLVFKKSVLKCFVLKLSKFDIKPIAYQVRPTLFWKLVEIWKPIGFLTFRHLVKNEKCESHLLPVCGFFVKNVWILENDVA